MELVMDDDPEEWGAQRMTGAPQSSTGCNLDRAKLVLKPHLLLGCNRCRHSGISLSKVSGSYDSKLTNAVFLGADLDASCLQGALPKVTPVNFLCAGIK